MHRLQAWPRGYAGDFETVEWLCDARNRAPIGTVPWAIEQCALQSPVAQQHRNKVGLQARAILSTLAANPGARIASIGCGGCRDLSLIQDYVPPSHGTFVLIDADADALAFARERLDRLEGRCRFVHGRVPRVLGSCGTPAASTWWSPAAVRLPAGSLGGGDAERRPRPAPAGGRMSSRTSRPQPVPPLDSSTWPTGG